jgi:hypothetical protein
MRSEPHRNVSKCIVGIRNSGFQTQGLLHDQLSIRESAELKQNVREHTVRWQANALAFDGVLRVRQCLGEAAILHEIECRYIRHRCR